MLNFSFNSKTSKHMMFTHKVPQLTKKFLFSTFMCPKPNWNLRHKHCNHWSFYPWSNIVKFEKITYLKSIFFLSKCYPSLDFTPSGKYGGGQEKLELRCIVVSQPQIIFPWGRWTMHSEPHLFFLSAILSPPEVCITIQALFDRPCSPLLLNLKEGCPFFFCTQGETKS